MLYNNNLGKIKTSSDCITCFYFDKKLKKCSGIGKYCFEFDEKTNTAIDPVTKLSIKLNIKEK